MKIPIIIAIVNSLSVHKEYVIFYYGDDYGCEIPAKRYEFGQIKVPIDELLEFFKKKHIKFSFKEVVSNIDEYLQMYP